MRSSSGKQLFRSKSRLMVTGLMRLRQVVMKRKVAAKIARMFLFADEGAKIGVLGDYL